MFDEDHGHTKQLLQAQWLQELISRRGMELVGGMRVRVRPDDIVEITSLEARKHHLDDAQDVVATIQRLTRGKRARVLLDLNVTGGLETDARDYYKREGPGFATAIAVVTANFLGRVVGNLIVTSHEGLVPVRLFDDEASAVAWLEEHPMRAR